MEEQGEAVVAYKSPIIEEVGSSPTVSDLTNGGSLDNDIKFVLLKITALKNNPNELFKISIKYGNKERYSFDSFILSTLMGIALSLPNIILFCCSKNATIYQIWPN